MGSHFIHPKGSGLKAALVEKRRRRSAHLALIEQNGEWWVITANARGVTVRRWHAKEGQPPTRTFTFETLVANTVRPVLTPAAKKAN